MRNSTTSFITALLGGATLFMGASAVSAQSIWTGSDSGSYFGKVCPSITNVIGRTPNDEVIAAGFLEDGQPLFFDHVCQVSGGTIDNMAKVRQNPMDLGIGQFDQLAGDAEGLFVIPTGVSECLYVVTKDENMVSTANLAPRTPFGLPGESSGSTATFMDLEPFNSMRRITNFPSAKAAVDAVDAGTVMAAGFVQIPDTTNSVFEAAEDLNFVGVISRSMLRTKVNGVSVYEGTPSVAVRAGSAWQTIGLGAEAQSITTACTPVVVFGTDPAMLEGADRIDQQDLMVALQNAANAGLLIPDTGDWRAIFGSLAESRREFLEGAIDLLE